ncbi:hypothetical protein MMC17_006080 [Xylographa soralifera]|nr:hypothetical protein [Xylographa soralifera]
MSPRRVFASVAKFSIYRLEQLAEKEDRSKAKQWKRVEDLQRIREDNMQKGLPVVEEGHVSPRQTTLHDPSEAGKQLDCNKDRGIHGIETDKENGIKNTTKNMEARKRSGGKEARGKERKPVKKMTSNIIVPADQVLSNEISHKARLEQQFSSIMPRTWGRSGGTARLPEPFQIMPRIRKARQADMAEKDFDFAEEDAALFAQIRSPDMKLKRKRQPEANSPVQHGQASSPHAQVSKYWPIAKDSHRPQLPPIRPMTASQSQNHRSPAVRIAPSVE